MSLRSSGLDRDGVDLVEHIDARDVLAVPLDDVDQLPVAQQTTRRSK